MTLRNAMNQTNFEHKVLRKILGSKGNEVGKWVI